MTMYDIKRSCNLRECITVVMPVEIAEILKGEYENSDPLPTKIDELIDSIAASVPTYPNDDIHAPEVPDNV